MRARLIAVCIVLVAGTAIAVRACAPVDEPEPVMESTPLVRATANESETEVAEESPRVEADRVRAHVRRPTVEPGASPGDEDVRSTITVDGGVPEADRGTGDASVHIVLTDAETERVVGSYVRLWRLGVPADDRWPAGDHIQAEFRADGMHRVGNLPAGRYRLQVFARRAGSEDPPEFDVLEGAASAFSLRIEVPPEVPMRLRVYDEHGVPLTEGTRATTVPDGGTWTWSADAPAWAHPRVLRSPAASGLPGRRGGWRSIRTGDESWTAVAAASGLFDLGSIRRSGVSHGWLRGYRYRFPDRTDVWVRVQSRDADDTDRYVAVSVLPQPLIDSIRLPDGTRASDAGAEISMRCPAVPAPPGSDGLWRTVPIRVTAKKFGYEELKFTWCIGDGVPRTWTMQELESVDD